MLPSFKTLTGHREALKHSCSAIAYSVNWNAYLVWVKDINASKTRVQPHLHKSNASTRHIAGFLVTPHLFSLYSHHPARKVGLPLRSTLSYCCADHGTILVGTISFHSSLLYNSARKPKGRICVLLPEYYGIKTRRERLCTKGKKAHGSLQAQQILR